ncbi:myoD family inhibitor domain-containing protein-like [Plectropomus leopardus]|uniref:myoD family inhibitor domain-containing protein-like n=1 Tax=Plectropomus leopardus TaxID=160734 RepID=UPI001C4DC848|nr:myoD family inhibitor domain-containing protein-like [Plectropomus leopardus]
MLPGDHSPVDGTEEQDKSTEGSASINSAQEILSARDPVSRGNTTLTDLISTQPLPAAAPSAEASQKAAKFKKPHCDLQQPTCPRCGLTVPDHRLPSLSPSLSPLQGSSLSVKSGSSKKSRSSRRSAAGSHQPTATPADSCLHLLLACLSCQCSVLLLGLLEACFSCLHSSCSCCCHACARCCSAIQETTVEELNCHAHCHSVLFESCCEPTEFLEFCLECCEICHRS